MADRVVRVQLVGDATSLISAANTARTALTGLANTNLGSVRAGIEGAGDAAQKASGQTSGWKDALQKGLAIVGVQAGFDGIVSGFKSVISAGLDYQGNMNTLHAVTGANAQQMGALGAKAQELGRDLTLPQTSASDAASAMVQLAKGGLSVQESMDAAKGSLMLATAAQVSGAQAAEIEAKALNAFGLAADQAGHVADLLANGANAATGEVTDMAAGLQQSATVAHGFGISVDDTAVTLALFAKNGVIGSDAGTSFKTMLTQLASPTKNQRSAMEDLNLVIYDSHGQFVGMKSITEQLSTAYKTMTTEQYNTAASVLFGTDAIRSANILGAEGTTGWNAMAESVLKAGGAQELAAAQTEGLNGSLNAFTSLVQTVTNALFVDLQPAMQKVVDAGSAVVGALGGMADKFTSLPAPVQAVVIGLGAVLLLQGPLLALGQVIGATLVQAFGALASPIATMRMSLAATQELALSNGVAMGVMRTAMAAASITVRTLGVSLWTAFMSNPIGWILMGISAALMAFSFSSSDATVTTADLSDAIDKNTGKLKDNATAAKAVNDSFQQSGDEQAAKYQGIGGAVGDYTAALLGNVDAQDRVHTVIQANASAVLQASNEYQRYMDVNVGSKMTLDEYTTGVLNHTIAVNLNATGVKDAIGVSDSFAGSQRQLADAAAKTAAGLQEQESATRLSTAATVTASQTDLDLEQALKNCTGALGNEGMAAALKQVKGAAEEADTAGQFLWATMELLTGGVVTAEQQANLNAAAIRGIGQASRDTADAQQKVIDATATAADVTDHLGRTMDGQAVSATNLAVTQADVDKAQRAVADATDAAAAAGENQDAANVKAGQSALDMAGSAYHVQAAQGNLTQAVADATAVMVTQRQNFIDAQLQINDHNVPAAEALADKYHLIPGDVATRLHAEGLTDLIKQVDDLNTKLSETDKRVIHYTIVGDQVVQHSVAQAGGATTTDIYSQKAAGGLISGPGGPRSDSIPTRLSNGEFVVNADATAKNFGLLAHINGGYAFGGLVRGFAAGGVVPVVAPAVSAPAPAAAASAAAPVASAAPAADPSAAPGMVPDSAAIAAAWAELSAAIADSWGGAILPVFDELDARTIQAGTEFGALDTAQATPAWTDIAATVSGAWAGIIAPTYDALDAGTNWAGATWAYLNQTAAADWASINGTIYGTWAGGIAPTYDALNAGTNWVGANWALLNQTSAADWAGINGTIYGTWSGGIAPTYDALNAGSINVGNQMNWLQSAMVAPAWAQIGASVSNAWNFTISPTFAAIEQGLQSLSTGFQSAGTSFAGTATSVGAAKTTIIDDINQVTTAINDFFTMVDGKAPPAVAAAVTAGVPALADGGMITQGTGPRTDDVHIRASRGEYVVNANATARNKATLDRINYGGAYANGGQIGAEVQNAIVDGAERAIGAGVDRIIASIPASSGGTSTASGFTSSQDPSSFGWVRASNIVDYSWNGLSTQVAGGTGGLWTALLNALAPQIQGGVEMIDGYQDRDNRNSPGVPSFHAYGLAMDVNEQYNANGASPNRTGQYVVPPGPANALASQLGMLWGGAFTGTTDPMHFEIHVPPTGISAATSPTSAPVTAAAGASWAQGVLAKIKAGGTAAVSGGTPGAPSSAGVEQWRSTVLQALALTGQSPGLANIVLHQMDTESSGNPAAINLTDCLTLDASILTRRGWLKHDEVRVGDETIGYNPTTGCSEWTPVTRVVHYEDAPLVRLSHSRWATTTTPNHRWINFPREHVPKAELSDQCTLCTWPASTPRPVPLSVCPECGWLPKAPGGVALHRRRKHGVLGQVAAGTRVESLRRRGGTTDRGIQIHLAKAHGIRSERQQSRNAGEMSWVKSEAIDSRSRLLLSAPAATVARLDVTVQEAAILGWIAGDGHVEKYVDQPRGRKSPSMSIGQSKPNMVVKLRALLEGIPHAEYSYPALPTRMGNAACGPRHHFRLDPAYAQDLLRRAGHPKGDAVEQILAMSTAQREAWLEAMIDAEGHRETDGKVGIAQCYGAVLEAITLAVYLSGRRPRVLDRKVDQVRNPNWNPSAMVFMNEPILTGAFLDKEDAGRGAVWCVTTDLGSWTARDGDHVFLTGNSNAQKGIPSKGLLQVIDPTFRSYAMPGYNSNIYDPLSNIIAAIRYTIGAYGGVAQGMQGHAYDDGGMLPTGWSNTYNGTGTPETVMTDQQWAIAGSAMNHVVSATSGGGYGPLDIVVTLNGDGPLSERIAQVSSVTVNGTVQRLANAAVRARGQR